MSTDLREELTALAETQTFSPDPSAWDRGRRARRRTRVTRGAAVLAVVALVAGAGVIVERPDAVGPAGGVDGEAAVPSVIQKPVGQSLTDLAFGRASVAYVDPFAGQPVLVDAMTGESHYVELPDFPDVLVDEMAQWFFGPWLALSPDGRQVAYPTAVYEEGPEGQPSFTTTWYRVVDLETGEASLVDVPPATGTPRAISWTADGRLAADVYGRQTARDVPPPMEAWTLDPETGESSTSALTGVVAPGGAMSAMFSESSDPVAAVPFQAADGTSPDRALPTDLYPDGASVTPLGWAASSLLVAQVDAPAGSHVEGNHLALLTSPDLPESEWTYNILMRDVPDTPSLSIAVDLIPDLTGDPDQELTHDFDEEPAGGQAWVSRAETIAGYAGILLGIVLLASRGRRRT